MNNQELELTEELFAIEAEERLETVQVMTNIVESCCIKPTNIFEHGQF